MAEVRNPETGDTRPLDPREMIPANPGGEPNPPEEND